jgi:hypothetical protein
MDGMTELCIECPGWNNDLELKFPEIADLVDHGNKDLFRANIDTGAAIHTKVIEKGNSIMSIPKSLGRTGFDAFHPAGAFFGNDHMGMKVLHFT